MRSARKIFVVPGADVKLVQMAAKKAEANLGAGLFSLKECGETNLNHQCRQESHNEGQHRIDANTHHADLVRKEVAAFLGRRLDGHRALAFDQAADDFHGGCDTVDLRVADGRLARFIIGLGVFASGVDFGIDAVHALNSCRQICVKLTAVGLVLGGQRGFGG